MTMEVLDARRLLCPLPVIRVQDKVNGMRKGAVLEVVGTDPGILNDIPTWCRLNGHTVLEARSKGDDYIVTLMVC